MIIQNRDICIEACRYGFNGMEKDDAVKGDGNPLAMKKFYFGKLKELLSYVKLRGVF